MEGVEIHIIGVSLGILFGVQSFPVSSEFKSLLEKGRRMWSEMWPVSFLSTGKTC